MRVAYFPNQCALNSVPVMQAMLNSLRNAGHTCIENSMDCDAAIIWSVLWKGRMQPNQLVYNHYRSLKRPVIAVDVGALYRGETWKVAVNNINALGYYGHTEKLDMDRPRKLGISLAINLSRNPTIVIAAQHRASLQVTNLSSIEDWVSNQIKQLRAVTDRPIIVRPHPRSSLQSFIMDQNVTIERPRRDKNTYDSYNLAFDCYAMVNYNSGPGIQAALAGTRPIVDQTSLAYPVSILLEELEAPYTVDRDQWLIEICHTEYTLKELEQGLWIQRIQSAL